MGRYRKSQEGNRSRFYMVLSVILIIVMFKWGFPLFVKVIAGKAVEVSKKTDDIIPPQPPILSAVPEATNEGLITIDGFTEQGAKLELTVNDILNKTDKAKDDGSFSILANLNSGQNRVPVGMLVGEVSGPYPIASVLFRTGFEVAFPDDVCQQRCRDCVVMLFCEGLLCITFRFRAGFVCKVRNG